MRDAEDWGGRGIDLSSAVACAGLVLVYKGRIPSNYLEALAESKLTRHGGIPFRPSSFFPNGVL